MDTVHVKRSDETGQFYWHRKAPNGEIISGGETHPQRRGAIRAAQRANLDNNWTWDRTTLQEGT